MSLLRLGVMSLDEAKTLQRTLIQQGVKVELNHNEATCTRGCTVTVEVLAQATDLPAIRETLSTQFKSLAQGHQVDWSLLDATFDPAAASATCPACGTVFATSKTECPDCGLMFA